ncbi:MAG: MerR family transcriptional regulator, partial [bacterium]
MSRLLTLKEIAKQLNVPESSLRKYREIFEDFMPGVGSGRGRRYREDAVVIFQDIRRLREDEHMPWEAVTVKLAEKYPMNAPSAPGPGAAARESAPPAAAGAHAPHTASHHQAAVTPRPAPPAPDDLKTLNALLKRIAALNEKQM